MCICWCSCYAVSLVCQPAAALKQYCEQNYEIQRIDWDGSESPLTESPVLTLSSAYKPFFLGTVCVFFLFLSSC